MREPEPPARSTTDTSFIGGEAVAKGLVFFLAESLRDAARKLGRLRAGKKAVRQPRLQRDASSRELLTGRAAGAVKPGVCIVTDS